jgi:hypothetical protein
VPRLRGSGSHGSVRALRLPHELDQWFESRLNASAVSGASALLSALVACARSLRSDHRERQRRSLGRLRLSRDRNGYMAYLQALDDTFGPEFLSEIADELVDNDSSHENTKENSHV